MLTEIDLSYLFQFTVPWNSSLWHWTNVYYCCVWNRLL